MLRKSVCGGLLGPALYGLNTSELPEGLVGGLLAYELNG